MLILFICKQAGSILTQAGAEALNRLISLKSSFVGHASRSLLHYISHAFQSSPSELVSPTLELNPEEADVCRMFAATSTL